MSVDELISKLEKHKGKEVYVGDKFIHDIDGVELDENHAEVVYIVTA